MSIGLTNDEVASIDRPTATAAALPNRAYVDPAFLEHERTNVFGPTWVCVGTGSSIPRLGDVRPVSWLGAPLVLVRSADGRINVFHNVCRHRGSELVGAAGNAGGAIRCPYHSWTYGLEGDLRATPHVGGPGVHHLESIDPASCGLVPARSAVWLDQVFVNVSADAPPFNEFIAPLQARLDSLADPVWFDRMHADTELGTLSFAFQGNWKLCVENNLEAYHLPWVHPNLAALSPLEEHEMFFGDGFAGQITRGYDHKSITGDAFSVIDGWPGLSAEYPTLYPNLFLGLQCDHFWTRRIEPITPDRSIDVLQIYYFDERALSADMATVRAQRTEAWKEVFTEDLAVVEGMQRGRHSPAFDGGRFSEVMDATSHHFARWAAQRLGAS
ncbi:MAG: aromatic ring-hydroxylating dioxygenase subunit alpha [Acidimicrobiales bacterium]|nr:aromatic ring-hydroxylating dioxygenase subunit alpha [Acidimicrobiales bacterium]MDG1875862.1 aromatic ring-hydroxylating dioxygenase subunit alpha [Acidimicrobiales bacterium]